MSTTQITLTEAEDEMLRALTERTGKAQDALLREALGLLMTQFASQDRRALLQKARGMWRDRDDLPRQN